MSFFNQQASDVLQHIAVFFEIGALGLVWRDYKIRESDLQKKGRGTSLVGVPVPHEKRTKGLVFAFVVAVVAVLMEAYQLASQYLAEC